MEITGNRDDRRPKFSGLQKNIKKAVHFNLRAALWATYTLDRSLYSRACTVPSAAAHDAEKLWGEMRAIEILV
jgi:hypothetical protein